MTPEELAERGLRVRPLTWGDYAAVDLYGDEYEVQQYGDVFEIEHPRLFNSHHRFPTIEAAKAAAEADHASRIAAQLEGMG